METWQIICVIIGVAVNCVSFLFTLWTCFRAGAKADEEGSKKMELKVGDKVLEKISEEAKWEWEVHEIREDSVVLKTLWQGTGVSDEESLYAYREFPLSEVLTWEKVD